MFIHFLTSAHIILTKELPADQPGDVIISSLVLSLRQSLTLAKNVIDCFILLQEFTDWSMLNLTCITHARCLLLHCKNKCFHFNFQPFLVHSQVLSWSPVFGVSCMNWHTIFLFASIQGDILPVLFKLFPFVYPLTVQDLLSLSQWLLSPSFRSNSWRILPEYFI